MAVYAQHGYGKGEKIETAIRAGTLAGLILNPRYESPDRLAVFAQAIRREFEDRVAILFDPQFYATTVPQARDGFLSDYVYYRPGLTRRQFIAQRDIRAYVEGTLRYQSGLPVDRSISPSVLFNDFGDPWSQIALSMGQEAIFAAEDMEGPGRLLVSLVFDEAALRNPGLLNDFLDIITTWKTAGFYILVRRNDPSYPALFDETVLQNLMYMVYVLAEINGFEVVCGYADQVGALLSAVGAAATGSGWYNSLRQFSLARFEPKTGGRAPRSRYTSSVLLNSILVIPELQTAFTLGELGNILSRTAYDGVMQATGGPASAAWSPETACLHHWEVLSRLDAEFRSGTVGENLDKVERRIQEAVAAYSVLERAGVPFDPATGSRDATIWLRAIRGFRQDTRV